MKTGKYIEHTRNRFLLLLLLLKTMFHVKFEQLVSLMNTQNNRNYTKGSDNLSITQSIVLGHISVFLFSFSLNPSSSLNTLDFIV